MKFFCVFLFFGLCSCGGGFVVVCGDGGGVGMVW